MRRSLLALTAAAVVAVSACTGGGSTASPGGGGTSAGPGTSTGGAAFDPNAVEGDLLLQGFSAGQVEDDILNPILDKFMEKYPKIKVRFEAVAGEYPTVMLAKLSAGEPPDLFYVQQGYAQDWIDQGVLQELDTFATERGFDKSKFYEGYLAPFIGRDGKTYGFPKDASILAMQYNTDMLTEAGVTEPPTTVEELGAAAEKLKATGVTPMCFSNEFARAGAFVYAFGGAVLTEDKSAPAFDSAETREALTWYLDQIEKGNAKRPVDLDSDWCGKALGTKKVAIAFEGNWIGSAMEKDYPDVKYEVAPIPSAKIQKTLSFTAAYAMGVDGKNKDASWVLLDYLAGQEGMQAWVDGGLVLPSRSDVTGPEDKKVYSESGEFATPGEGLIPAWAGVQDAFNNSMTAAIEGSGSVDDIVSKTTAAIEKALNQ